MFCHQCFMPFWWTYAHLRRIMCIRISLSLMFQNPRLLSPMPTYLIKQLSCHVSLVGIQTHHHSQCVSLPYQLFAQGFTVAVILCKYSLQREYAGVELHGTVDGISAPTHNKNTNIFIRCTFCLYGASKFACRIYAVYFQFLNLLASNCILNHAKTPVRLKLTCKTGVTCPGLEPAISG